MDTTVGINVWCRYSMHLKKNVNCNPGVDTLRSVGTWLYGCFNEQDKNVDIIVRSLLSLEYRVYLSQMINF